MPDPRIEGATPPPRRSVRAIADKRALLSDHPLFGELGPDLLDRLHAHAVMHRVPRGTTIFVKGDPGESLFAICSGSVKIVTPSGASRDAILNVLHPGSIFGEIALLDGRPRSADATALTDCEFLVIHRRDFLPLLQAEPGLAQKLIEVLCERLRRTTEQLEDVMFLDLPARLAKALLLLSHQGKPARGGAKVALTQREIGHMIGMSRESTNKQLRSWERQRWIRLERGGIVVLAPAALAAVAGAKDAD
jgi:CRP/FNR family transcriptional regulator, cyclic AMP receptor protein